MVIGFAIDVMYRVEMLGQERDSEQSAERAQPAPSGNNSANDGIPERGSGSSPTWALLEETREAEDFCSEDTLRYIAIEFKLLPLLSEASPADRVAAASHLETLLLLVESKDMFWVDNQTAGGAATSPPPLEVTQKDFAILEEYVAAHKAMSREARNIVQTILDFAFTGIIKSLKLKDALLQSGLVSKN